jgi:hypothetical protein
VVQDNNGTPGGAVTSTSPIYQEFLVYQRRHAQPRSVQERALRVTAQILPDNAPTSEIIGLRELSRLTEFGWAHQSPRARRRLGLLSLPPNASSHAMAYSGST